MQYQKGDLLIFVPPSEKDYQNLTKEDRKIIKKIIKDVRPEYLLCIGQKTDSYYECLCVYTKYFYNTLELSNNANLNLWVNSKIILYVNSMFFKKSGYSFQVSDTFLESFMDIYKNKKSVQKTANMSNKLNGKKEKKKEKKEKTLKQMKKHNAYYARKNKDRKAYEKELRETAMKDPRYYANEGVIKNNKGAISNYKSHSSNDWHNIHAPVSAGRGNF